MTNQHKAALKSLLLAGAQYLQAVASTFGEDEATATETPKPAPAKKAAAPKPAPVTPVAHAQPPAATPAPTPAAAAPVAVNGPTPTEPLMAQARAAAKSYAEVYGREGLKEVLSKFTTGTMADVAADKLPELLKELKA